jgi:glycolate oxidase iron-sulfur subunit
MNAARRLIEAFERIDVDVIAINAAGCGSAMKRYGHLLRNDPQYAERANVFAAKCRDISEVLAGLAPRAARGRIEARVAYHDACHLQHAQGVRVPPRRLLEGIPGVELRDVPEPEICCGSAGIYNMLEPEAAAQLRDRKVENIMRTEPDLIVSSNPGCLLQITDGLRTAGRRVPVLHLVELLDRSITGGRTHVSN